MQFLLNKRRILNIILLLTLRIFCRIFNQINQNSDMKKNFTFCYRTLC